MSCAFIPWALKINSNESLSKSMCNRALQPLKTLYLHYRNVYGHQTWQTWQGGDLPRRAPTHQST